MRGHPIEQSGATGGRARRLSRGLVELLVAASLVTGCGSSHKLPAGGWGKTIKCLESHPLFSVTDTNSAKDPGRRTTAVTISSQIHGYQLVTIEQTASHAAALTVEHKNDLLSPTANYGISGDVVWAWQEGGDNPHVLATALDQANILHCIDQDTTLAANAPATTSSVSSPATKRQHASALGPLFVLRRYWREMAAGNFARAWASFAPGATGKTESDWIADQQANGIERANLQGSATSRGSTATVVVKALVIHTRVNGCQRWTGTYDLERERGAWLITQADITPTPCSN